MEASCLKNSNVANAFATLIELTNRDSIKNNKNENNNLVITNNNNNVKSNSKCGGNKSNTNTDKNNDKCL